MFVSELWNNFGLHDPEGEAEASLENLRMRKNQWMTKYLVEFNWLAACVQWGDTPLCRQLYNGFPLWIYFEGSTSSMRATVLLQTVCNALVWGQRHFLTMSQICQLEGGFW